MSTRLAGRLGLSEGFGPRRLVVVTLFVTLAYGCSPVATSPSTDLPTQLTLSSSAAQGELPSIDPERALDLMIRPSQLRGVDSDYKIVDSQALGESLEAAGLAQAQIDALVANDLTLDRYTELVRLEIDCVAEGGVVASDITITDSGNGVEIPSYGVPAEVPGLTEGQIAYLQAVCQNRFTGAFQPLYRAAWGPSREEEGQLLIDAANRFMDCARTKDVSPPFDTIDESSLDGFFTWLSTDEVRNLACTFSP